MDVGVKASVAVLDGAVVVRTVDSLLGCRMVVACLANLWVWAIALHGRDTRPF